VIQTDQDDAVVAAIRTAEQDRADEAADEPTPEPPAEI
jgi:hypothetical protein